MRHDRGRSGIVTLQVGGVNLPNVLIDSGATSTLPGKAMWEWFKTQKFSAKPEKMPRSYLHMGTPNH